LFGGWVGDEVGHCWGGLVEDAVYGGWECHGRCVGVAIGCDGWIIYERWLDE
jgi:hypothetical protein